MMRYLPRWGSGVWRTLTRRADRNRRAVYGGRYGLRVVTFHATPPSHFAHFRRVVEWCLAHYDPAVPEDVDALFAGEFSARGRDKVLFTFDDGFRSNFAAAGWLHSRQVRSVFFVVPSFLNRTIGEFLEYHRLRGVEATDISVAENLTSPEGLTHDEVRQMASWGHRIAGHNNAHRTLGDKHDDAAIQYEVDDGLAIIEELTGRPCHDFAWAWGHDEYLSAEAQRRLEGRCRRIYCAIRGLNAPGLTPNVVLRESVLLRHPWMFQRVCVSGGVDDVHLDKQARMFARFGKLAGGAS